MKIFCYVLFATVLAGCIVTKRINYSFDDPLIYNGSFHVKNKYHIAQMRIRLSLVGSGQEHVIEKTHVEIEDCERCLPNVFGSSGIPIRVDIKNSIESHAGILTGLNMVISTPSLWIIPVCGLDGNNTGEERLEISSSNMRNVYDISVHSSSRSWLSTIGLGVFMPMPDPIDERFSVEGSASAFSSYTEMRDKMIAMDNKVTAYAIAAALERLESENSFKDLHRGAIQIGR